jgi:hypothetical protein
MAKVKIESAWKCYNMNPQKLEQLLHNFFGSSSLNIDIFDENKIRFFDLKGDNITITFKYSCQNWVSKIA